MRTITSALGRQTALLTFLGIFVIFTISLGSDFTSSGNLSNVARTLAISAPLVMGQAIVLISGGIDISVGATMAMAAALSVGLQQYGVLVSVGAAIAFGALVGALNGFLVAKVKIVAFIATVGTMLIVRGMMLVYTGEGSISSTTPGFGFWGGGSLGPIPVPFVISLLIILILWVLLRYFKIGREMYAVGGNKETAYLAGVPVARVQATAFVWSGMLSAVSGVLIASRLESATPQIGVNLELFSIAAAVIGGASILGGRGGVFGAFFGLAALVVLTNGMNLLGITTYFQIATNAVLLIVVVVLDALRSNRTAGQKFRPSSPTGEDEQIPKQKPGVGGS